MKLCTITVQVDIAPEHVLKNTVQNLASILKKPGVRKKPYLVRGRDEVITAARNITTDSLAPIFLTSAVTGEGGAGGSRGQCRVARGLWGGRGWVTPRDLSTLIIPSRWSLRCEGEWLLRKPWWPGGTRHT